MTVLELLRHTIATLAYRAGKAMSSAPESFASFQADDRSNTPLQIVGHMGDLFDWALTIVKGEPKWITATPQSWGAEVARFHTALNAFDSYLASGTSIKAELTLLFQGPIADALTHTGQLAMLRRLAGCQMKSENYTRAEIIIGCVGSDQTPANPKNEFN